MKKALLLVVALLATQAAYAQGFIPKLEEVPRNPQVMSELMIAAGMAPTKDKQGNIAKLQFSMAGIRGGNGSNKPLGQYLVQPNMEFKSEYKKESAETMCQFAFDLHQFIMLKGRDLEALQKNSALETVPYEKQKEFADMWWRMHSPKYKNMAGVWKDWFINDAIVDATNLWLYTYLRIENQGSADRTLIADAMMSALMKKKP
ncbi:MAG: hypothetical protein C0473_01760 [Cyanobacteria bacterium DS3.002]|jgi:hypothetical protein|nr:hypothetical protein [Cyanobacteria bacterium DS3.002]